MFERASHRRVLADRRQSTERRTHARRVGPRRAARVTIPRQDRRGSDRRAETLPRSGEERRTGERRGRPDRRIVAYA
jgi:hypothetical protein